MSFRVQPLANRYPKWSKLRRDPSSMGQRLLSVFGEYFDAVSIDNVKLKEELLLSKKQLGVGYLYTVALSEDDWIRKYHDTSYWYPYVMGIGVGDDKTLERVESLEDLLFSYPSAFVYDDTLGFPSEAVMWSTEDPGAYNTLPFAERLVVTVNASDEYRYNNTKTDPLFSGYTEIKLTGTDTYGNEFTERINLLDDGVYSTRNVFATLSEVTYNGFDGDIVVTLGITDHTNAPRIKDPFRVGISEDIEGPLYLSINEEDYSGYLSLSTVRYKAGSTYRRNVDADETLNIEELSKQILLDDSSSVYTPVDFCIHPDDGYLYVLDDTGRVHVHDVILDSMFPPMYPNELTDDVYVTVTPLYYRVAYNDEVKMMTWLQQPREQIRRVSIKIITPNGDEFWLQADKTFGVSRYYFAGKDRPLSEESWTDFDFPIEFDQIGQWEFYVYADAVSKTTVGWLAVNVESNMALKTYTLSEEMEGNPTHIFVTHDMRLAVKDDDDNVYVYWPRHYKYLADPDNQVLYIRERFPTLVIGYAP